MQRLAFVYNLKHKKYMLYIILFKNSKSSTVIQKINTKHKLCSIGQQKQIKYRFNKFSKCKYLFNGKWPFHTFYFSFQLLVLYYEFWGALPFTSIILSISKMKCKVTANRNKKEKVNKKVGIFLILQVKILQCKFGTF